MLTVLDAILTNPNFFIEPYLHQLMPPILTCLVAKRLSERPTEDHWSARNMAARLITRICSKYGNVYQTLQPRVTRTLLRAFLDPLKPLSTHYGAIVGLTHLGPAAVKSLIMPNLMAYLNLIRPELASQEESLKKSEAQKCFEALLVIFI
jgi:transcription initiation factor TFIID subunit 6